MQHLRILTFATCSMLVGCTLLVDGRLEKAASDSDADGSTASDAAFIPEEDAGDEQDAGQSLGDAGASTEREGGSTEPARDAQAAADAAQAMRSELQTCLGEDHACAVNKAGKITCWGANAEDQGRFPPDRAYRRVACGDFHSCALDSAGQLLCVGRNRDRQRAMEPGPYDEVAAGDAHTCVLDAAGSARCFGLNTGGQSTPPALALRDLTAGTGFTCGIRRSDSRVQCWGFGAADLTNAVADTAFASIDAARSYLCGVTDTGAVRCWSQNQPPAPDRALKVSAGGFGACALLADRGVRCWSGNNLATPFADKGPFRDVIVGGTGRCLVPEQGAILCEPDPPSSALSPGPASLD